MNLAEQLAAADRKFDRPAIPAVFAEYETFSASGRYPYNDSVVAKIALVHRVSEAAWGPRQRQEHPRFDHQAVHDLGDPLLIQLHHEVYLASGQHKAARMAARADALAAEGYQPITAFEPYEGARIVVTFGHEGETPVLLRCKAAGGGRTDWALLAPRKRTHGLSLNGMVAAHLAYEMARADKQTKHNGPAVVMFKAAS